jgi:prepilin-type processing-associated H-X9-DG protein
MRRAYTLVEALVAAAAAAALIALALPAVQSAREAASRLRCSGNLRQLALGSLNYAAATGHLPHGGSTPQCAYLYGLPHAGWGYAVLPYVGGENVYRLPTWRAVSLANPPDVFNCPSRRGITRNAADGPWLSDYAGLAPTAAPLLGGIWQPQPNGEQFYYGWVWGFPAPPSVGPYDGAVTRLTRPGGRGAPLADFPGGYGNTALYAEKRLCGAYYGGAWWADHDGPGGGWTDAATPCWAGAPPGRDQCGPVRDGPGSAHPASLNVVYADGHVAAVSYAVGGAVFARSCSRR